MVNTGLHAPPRINPDVPFSRAVVSEYRQAANPCQTLSTTPHHCKVQKAMTILPINKAPMAGRAAEHLTTGTDRAQDVYSARDTEYGRHAMSPDIWSAPSERGLLDSQNSIR